MHRDAANDRGHANQSIRSDLLSIHKHFNQTITEEILWFTDQTRGWLKENNIFDNWLSAIIQANTKYFLVPASQKQIFTVFLWISFSFGLINMSPWGSAHTADIL